LVSISNYSLLIGFVNPYISKFQSVQIYSKLRHWTNPNLFGGVPERSNGAVSKTAESFYGSGGSNPSTSATSIYAKNQVILTCLVKAFPTFLRRGYISLSCRDIL